MGCDTKQVVKTGLTVAGAVVGSVVPGVGTAVGAAVGAAVGTAATGGDFKAIAINAAVAGLTASVALEGGEVVSGTLAGAGTAAGGAGASGAAAGAANAGLMAPFGASTVGGALSAGVGPYSVAAAGSPSLLSQAIGNVPGAGQLNQTFGSTFPQTSAAIDAGLGGIESAVGFPLERIGGQTLANLGGGAATIGGLAQLDQGVGNLGEMLTQPMPDQGQYYGDINTGVIPQRDPSAIDPTNPNTPIEDVVRVAPEYFARTGPGGTISTGLVDPADQLSNEIGTYYTNPDVLTTIGQLPPVFQEASVDNIIRRLTTNVNDPGFDNFQDVLGTGVRTRANQLSPGTTLDEYNALFNDPNLPNTILRPEAFRRLETALPSSATEGDQFNLPDDFDFSSILGPQRDPVAQQVRTSAARGNLNPAGLDYALSDIDRISTEAESDLRNLAGPVASRFDTGFGSDYGSLRDRTRQDITDFDFVGNTTGRQFDFEDIGRQGTDLLTSSQPRFAEEIDTLFRAQPSRFDYQDIANRAGTSSGFATGAPVTTGPDDRAVIDALRRRDTSNVRGVGSTGAGVF